MDEQFEFNEGMCCKMCGSRTYVKDAYSEFSKYGPYKCRECSKLFGDPVEFAVPERTRTITLTERQIESLRWELNFSDTFDYAVDEVIDILDTVLGNPFSVTLEFIDVRKEQPDVNTFTSRRACITTSARPTGWDWTACGSIGGRGKRGVGPHRPPRPCLTSKCRI